MLASYLLNPTESDHALSEIAKQQLQYPLPHDDEVYGKGAKREQLEDRSWLSTSPAKPKRCAYCSSGSTYSWKRTE